jgi:pyruvate dehydrogenase E2 component (dihydrolipoamide acetyltransferase)
MATAVEVPQFGNTVEECLIARWVKRKGDAVAAGDVVAEIETDKTTFEVTAPVGGTVLETFFEAGALVPVFTKLFVIGNAGESVETLKPISGRSGRSSDRPIVAAATPGPTARSKPTATQAFSPRARRFADAHNFHPASIAGSGPGGRVIEDDVRKAYESVPRTSGLRQTIARRMRESLASTAQYTLNASAGAAGLLRLRARLKTAPATAEITINDLVSFCTVRALIDAPDVNAEYIDGAIVKHAEVHLAFACDTPKGLIAPVVRDAHLLTAGELAAQMKSLAARAVEGTVPPEHLAGATFTISNLGGLGIESFTPVINPPQVAILGVGAIQLKAVRRGNNIVYVDMIGLSLTCDHQVIDGAPGARFLSVVRDKIENVESIYA